MVVDVPINLAYPITPEALTRRIIRQLYWALVRSGVSGLAPEMVADARLACLRTVASLKEVHDETLKETFKNEFKVNLDLKNGVGVTAGASAQKEFTLARRISQELGPSSREEMDGQLLKLLDEMDATCYGASEKAWARLGRLVEWCKGAWSSFKNKAGIKFNVVFILDELDKLEYADEEEPPKPVDLKWPEPEPDSGNRNIQWLRLSMDLEKKLAEAIPSQPQTIRSVKGLARAIKPILTSGAASFIIVSGARDAQVWHDQSQEPNALLPSVFSEHFHFGLMTPSEAEDLLKKARLPGFADLAAKDHHQKLLACWFLLECRGNYTQAISRLRGFQNKTQSAEELLKKEEDKRKALLGYFMDLELFDEKSQFKSALDDLGPILADQVRQKFLLAAEGVIEFGEALKTIEEIKGKLTSFIQPRKAALAALIQIADFWEELQPLLDNVLKAGDNKDRKDALQKLKTFQTIGPSLTEKARSLYG